MITMLELMIHGSSNEEQHRDGNPKVLQQTE